MLTKVVSGVSLESMQTAKLAKYPDPSHVQQDFLMHRKCRINLCKLETVYFLSIYALTLTICNNSQTVYVAVAYKQSFKKGLTHNL